MDRQLDFEHLLGMPVVVMDKLKEQYPDKFNESGRMDYKWFVQEIRSNNFIYVRHDVNSISFTVKDRPSSEGGQGAEAIHMVAAAKHMIEYLNSKLECPQNSEMVSCLNRVIDLWNMRTKDREKRNVEGTQKP